MVGVYMTEEAGSWCVGRIPGAEIVDLFVSQMKVKAETKSMAGEIGKDEVMFSDANGQMRHD